MTHAATHSDREALKAQLLTLHQARVDWEERFANGGVLCGAASFFGMLFEGYRWLQSGLWEPYRTWPIGRAVIDNSWLDAPTSWHGLQRLVTGFLDWPLFVTGPILTAVAGFFVWAMIEDHYEKKIKAFEEKHGVSGSYSELLDDDLRQAGITDEDWN